MQPFHIFPLSSMPRWSTKDGVASWTNLQPGPQECGHQQFQNAKLHQLAVIFWMMDHWLSDYLFILSIRVSYQVWRMTEYSQVALLDTDMVFDVDSESLLLSSLAVEPPLERLWIIQKLGFHIKIAGSCGCSCHNKENQWTSWAFSHIFLQAPGRFSPSAVRLCVRSVPSSVEADRNWADLARSATELRWRRLAVHECRPDWQEQEDTWGLIGWYWYIWQFHICLTLPQQNLGWLGWLGWLAPRMVFRLEVMQVVLKHPWLADPIFADLQFCWSNHYLIFNLFLLVRHRQISFFLAFSVAQKIPVDWFGQCFAMPPPRIPIDPPWISHLFLVGWILGWSPAR